MSPNVHDAVRERLVEDIAHLSELDAVEPADAATVDALLEEYDAEYGLERQLERSGETYVVARIVFDYLRDCGRATLTDTECIYGYAAYGDLLEEYGALADGTLADMTYEVDGDWSAGEDARLAVELSGERVEATMRHRGDWIDLDRFLKVLNRLLRDATDDTRRFSTVALDAGQAAPVVFLRPDRAEILDEYFGDAVECLERHREETR